MWQSDIRGTLTLQDVSDEGDQETKGAGGPDQQ
jgi:hypothetical protein